MTIRGVGLAALVLACSSPASFGNTTCPCPVPVYLIATNDDSLPAILILTINLEPPVQQHVAIGTCSSLPLEVPLNDTLEVIITDSTAKTSASYEVPIYAGGVWGVDVAPGSGPPVRLGNIGQVSTNCSTEGAG